MKASEVKVIPPNISDETRNAIGAFLARTSAPRILAKREEEQRVRKQAEKDNGKNIATN
ncbi:hypothetical protein HF078_07030 [Bacillus sp. RO2]|uniref:hypothetical protein n=1 Tax=Bacillus sp. RO2 TaxID=2723913 RepID=UPI00145DD40D|nr:hypothetical protein [Bacillus sp. RO2]NMH72819.1 hypothetical protein [Bacillus sp. RO2]